MAYLMRRRNRTSKSIIMATGCQIGCAWSLLLDAVVGSNEPQLMRSRIVATHQGEIAASASSTIEALWVSPQSAMAAMMGRSVLPNSVKRYSVFGGMTGYALRAMSPHPSSSRSSFVRMRSLTGGHARRNAAKRRDSFRISAQMILDFHLPPRMRDVKATGHGFGNSM